MKRLSLVSLLFAFLSVVFFLLLIFLRIPFPLYPLMSWQDALDQLTPLVLIPLYWVLYRQCSEKQSHTQEIAFMVLAALWVLGQGMHLAANSINNLAGALANNQQIDISGTALYQLVYFMDENLSHYMWHLGVMGLAALLIYREWNAPAGLQTTWWATIVGSLLYGINCFAIFVEGNTYAVGLPFSILLTLIILVGGRTNLGQRPIRAFFFLSFLITSVLMVGWYFAFGGFRPILEVFSF